MLLTDDDLTKLYENSKRDALPVGSEVRQMVGEIRWYRARANTPASNEAPGRGGVENPSAFPYPDLRDENGCGIMEGSRGMTLRDWFAGQFAGGCASGLTHVPEDDEELAQFRQEIGRVAQLSYMMADAMLAARKEAAA